MVVLVFSAARSALDHTIVAANGALFGRESVPLFGATATARFSLISTNADSGLAEAAVGSPDANGNLIGGSVAGYIDPKLGELGNNGGPTFTHALLIGSPALNSGDPTFVPGVGDALCWIRGTDLSHESMAGALISHLRTAVDPQSPSCRRYTC